MNMQPLSELRPDTTGICDALDRLLAPQARHQWLLDFAERKRFEREAREAFSTKAATREPVGERSRKIARILARDGEDCCYCKKPLGDDMTLEHRVARTRGGSDELDNLKLAHARCNREVGNLPPDMKDELVRRKEQSDD